jgi:hypothetical protein
MHSRTQMRTGTKQHGRLIVSSTAPSKGVFEDEDKWIAVMEPLGEPVKRGYVFMRSARSD